MGHPFAQTADDPLAVARHSWLPHIMYVKRTKRYRPKTGKTEFKDRTIMYASHRDACFLSRYAHELGTRLEAEYITRDIATNVIAYRSLGKSNYDFTAEAQAFARAVGVCRVLCYDISDFFGTLDHRLLKQRLKAVLGVAELPKDWYSVFRHVTKHRAINRDDLKNHPVFGPRLKERSRVPVATIQEVLAAGIPIHENDKRYGIPQGTPISSVLANLYLIDFDTAIAALCKNRGALYRRYSDDILIICKAGDETDIDDGIHAALIDDLLTINKGKTDRVTFDPSNPICFQYLGFMVSPQHTTLRPSSLAKQWRRLKRAIRKANAQATTVMASKVASTSKLRRQFSPVGARNFGSYARSASDALDAPAIRRQALRLERHADAAIRKLAGKP